MIRSLLLCLACAGCAVNSEGWEMKPSHAPLPAYFVDVDGASLQRICGPRPGWTYHGCAFRDYARNRCTIYVESNTPEWVADHEALHCAGFSHE